MKESNPSVTPSLAHDATVDATDPSKAASNDETIASTVVEPTTTNNDERMDHGTLALELEECSPSDNMTDEKDAFVDPDKETREPGAVKVDDGDGTCRNAKDDNKHITLELEECSPSDNMTDEKDAFVDPDKETREPGAVKVDSDGTCRNAKDDDKHISTIDPALEMVPDNELTPSCAPSDVTEDGEATKKPGSATFVKQSADDPRAASFKADVYARLFPEQHAPHSVQDAQLGSALVADGILDPALEMLPDNELTPSCASFVAPDDGKSEKPGSATFFKQSTDDPRAADFKADSFARLFPEQQRAPPPVPPRAAQPGLVDGIFDPALIKSSEPPTTTTPCAAPDAAAADKEESKKPGSASFVRDDDDVDPRAASFKADVYARLFPKQQHAPPAPVVQGAHQPGSSTLVVDGFNDDHHAAAAVGDLREDTVFFRGDDELEEPVLYSSDHPDQTASLHDSNNAILTAELVDDTQFESRIQEEIQQRLRDSTVVGEVVPDNGEKGSTKQKKMFLFILLVLGGVLGAVLGSVLGKNNNEEAPQLSNDELLLGLLTPISGDAILNESTPQFEAFQWMAFEDTAMLHPNVTSPSVLIDRYVAALLYFSTGGPHWFDSVEFLGNSSVCEWNAGNKTGDDDTGVHCNLQGSVVQIRLGKSGITLIGKPLLQESFC